MREPVSSTIGPPHVRGQIRVSDWTQLVPADKADAQRIKIQQTALGKQAAAAAKQRHAARLAECQKIATWPRHASGNTTRPTTRLVPRRTESGSRLDVTAIYRRYNTPSSATPATPAPAPPPSSPARARTFRDIARDAYGESASADASLVASSARGGR